MTNLTLTILALTLNRRTDLSSHRIMTFQYDIGLPPSNGIGTQVVMHPRILVPCLWRSVISSPIARRRFSMTPHAIARYKPTGDSSIFLPSLVMLNDHCSSSPRRRWTQVRGEDQPDFIPHQSRWYILIGLKYQRTATLKWRV